ncbi:MAG: hypothetical protein KAQ95_11270, partial [Candidatus Heimdallarchaeota archaeon]|nr:hypothetical protein [Candidatus Heimdallarchaeota archaeon]
MKFFVLVVKYCVFLTCEEIVICRKTITLLSFMKKYCSTWKIVIILLFTFSWVSKAAYFSSAVPFNNYSQNF